MCDKRRKAIRRLQRSLNVLNACHHQHVELAETGVADKSTLREMIIFAQQIKENKS